MQYQVIQSALAAEALNDKEEEEIFHISTPL